MSWLRIDDIFEDHAKVAPLSDAAHRMWMRVACWCKKPENAHSAGFVPAELLPIVSRLPAAKARKLAAELVASKGGGLFENGLWEARDGGWQFHDWDNYQPPERPPSDVHAAKSAAGKKGAAARWQRHGESPAEPLADDGKGHGRAMAENAPDPDPIPERDPPTPKPRPIPKHARRFEQSFAAQPRPDVVSLHERWKRATGLDAHELRGDFGFGDDYDTLAAKIDSFGAADCGLVADECMRDRKVNGEQDERGEQHTSIRYIFGNEHAFARILRDAKARKRKVSMSETDFDAAMEADA